MEVVEGLDLRVKHIALTLTILEKRTGQGSQQGDYYNDLGEG